MASVDVIMIREGKNTKGRLLEILLETIGKRSLARTLANTIKAIEARNYPEAGPVVNPPGIIFSALA